MKILFLSSLLAVLSTTAFADQLTDRCSGVSAHGSQAVVLVYRGQTAIRQGGDSIVVVSATGRGRRVYTSKIMGGTDVSETMGSGNNGGMKLTIHDAGRGFLWLGDTREVYQLTCRFAPNF